MKCIIIQGGPEVTLGLWNWIKKVEIQNLKKNNLWNFRWQESILEKLCRKITGHILVCLSICLCACAFLCLFVNKMHFQTPVSFLCATFRPCKYFQHFIWKKIYGTSNRSKIFQIVFEIWQIYDKIHLRKCTRSGSKATFKPDLEYFPVAFLRKIYYISKIIWDILDLFEVPESIFFN